MRMWYTIGGKETSIDVVPGMPLVLRSGLEERRGKFVGVETAGRGRWKRTMLRVRDEAGAEFLGPLFWFSPDLEALGA